MKLNKSIFVLLFFATIVGGISCEDGISVYDPEYESSEPLPVITNISPAGGYLAGVDSVIVTGSNFSTDPESLLIDFGGAPGTFLSVSETELIVRPGVRNGENLDVRVAVRGQEFFSEPYDYTLFEPFGVYPGLTIDDNPTSPVAVDSDNNVYTIRTNNKLTRYVKVTPDGTVTLDAVRGPEERDSNDDLYPLNERMRFGSYSSLIVGPGGELLLAQQSIRAIFRKTFGDGGRESVWAASSSSNFKIRDMVFDNNGFLWVVGRDSDQIHRFNATTKAETQFPFVGNLSAVAFYSDANELYVGGEIDSTQSIWKFNIDGSGNIGAGELYFDFENHYEGNVSSMILASNGELLIATGPQIPNVEKPSIVRVFPNGRHQQLHNEMIKDGAYSITWRDDKFAVVAIQGEETSINFLDMYDRTRSGIFGF